MALSDDNGIVMPVSPMNNGGFGGFGNDGGWWMILLFIILFGFGGNGWNNGNPLGIQDGFNQAALTSGIGDIQTSLCNGFSGVQTALCNGFSGVNSNIANGFAQAEISNNAREIANLQQNFATQTAITGGLNNLSSQLASCCCENRLASANLQNVIQTENCADRSAISDGIRDILVATSNNTQRILDQMCNDKIDAKNERIAELERELTMANLSASQTAQTSRILADNSAQTVALEQYLNPVPVPAYVVQNPNCCSQNGCGCY